MNFGERVRRLRRRRGWSQDQLAGVAQIAHGTVSRSENGDNISLDVAMKLAAAFGVSLSELVDDIGAAATPVSAALPGWDSLTDAEQEHLRGLVAAIADARRAPLRRVADGARTYEHGLDPAALSAAERAHREGEARESAERSRGRDDEPDEGRRRRRP